MLATNLFFPPDPDDSWQMSTSATPAPRGKPVPIEEPQVVDAGGGYKMIWEKPELIRKNLDASLRVRLLAPDNQPAQIEPYMGMLGHAVVRRQDGTVFAHIHPAGTFSMAAQQFFINGKPPKESVLQAQPALLASGESPLAQAFHNHHTNQAITVGEISFPYAFPQPGAYRFWVQMKSQGRILTGAFDTIVAAAQ
jgi:hypothetical protein